MNQENNFNTEGINGIPNNQPLQNNQELTNTFNQNIEQSANTNQQPTPQPVNYFENQNTNNQNFNSKPPKKNNLVLIISIICLLVIIIVTVVLLLTNHLNKENGSNNTNKTTEKANNNKKEKTSSVKLTHEIFDVNKFDPTLFNGIVYDENKTQYNVIDLLKNDDTICLKECSPLYHLTTDTDVEDDSWDQKANSDDNKGIDFILNKLGNPSTIYEKYYNFYDKKNMKTGDIAMFYNYKDYIIDIGFYDYRQWENYNYNSLQISHVMIHAKDGFDSAWASYYKDYKCYGEKLF